MHAESLIAAATIMVLAFVQNVSFSIVSRSRNRDSMKYHLVASIFSNGIWFLTFRELVTADMTLALFAPYTFGTVCGSLWGVKVAMRIERWLGASADSHVKRDPPFTKHREAMLFAAEERIRRQAVELSALKGTVRNYGDHANNHCKRIEERLARLEENVTVTFSRTSDRE